MDNLSNMLNGIKNAGLAGKTQVDFPHSKLKASVLECLKKEGYISSFKIENNKKGFPMLVVQVAYNGDSPKVNEIKRISKPSRRMYSGSKELKPFRNGYGRVILSTPKGILSEKDAKNEQVGGEVLFTIW
ncbi:MAG: 30S ribosomal protein S8 [Candidatus Pacebacteria bacterium]|nr:30S ribosomal protein S8 [Candidatus Paceibacterota bacterium]